MSVYARGRMLTQDISGSHKIASLSKDSLILFFMILPHLDSHGKINGEPHFIKGEVVPLLKYFTIDSIKSALREISKKTNMKWFRRDGLYYIHSISFTEHQNLNPKKIGRDELPNYSEVSQELRSPEVEVEVEGEVEVQGEVESLKLKPEKTTLRVLQNGNTDPFVEEVVDFCKDANSRDCFAGLVRDHGEGLVREAMGEIKMRVGEGEKIEKRGAYLVTLLKDWTNAKKK